MTEALFHLPFGKWVATFVDWITDSLSGFFDLIQTVFGALYSWVDFLFAAPPFWVVGIIIVLIALWARGWVFGIGTAVGLTVIYGMRMWDDTMHTLSLTIVATIIAIAVAIPVGIWMARSPAASTVIRPILDFLQTMPAFVYLIPAVILLGVGVVPGMMATIVFAIAPGVRLTDLGIREVDKEVVEAGHAFGASPGRILRQIQIPLARPTIMAGVNQVIMLSLSMVVIASMVAAPGLGRPILASFSTINVALGFEGGLSIVIVAILLDRITSTFGTGRTRRLLPSKKASIPDSPSQADLEEAEQRMQPNSNQTSIGV